MQQENKNWMISCNEATQMIVFGEHEKLTWKQKIVLQIHLLLCSVCKHFQRQSSQINQLLKQIQEKEIAVMSSAKKEEITLEIKKIID
jgi:molybdopterin-biosynthesis enzyme MoeA-like protein